MGYSILQLTQGEVVQPVQSLPAPVTRNRPARFAPTLRSGFFWARDRRYFLPARKASCWLEDLTWYTFRLTDQAVSATERVWVRGIEITGSGRYKIEGGFLSVNGTMISHPGILTEELAYDTSFLDPMILGDVLDPNDQVRVDYDYESWNAGASSGGSLSDGLNGGADFTMEAAGVFGDNWTLDVPVATGNPIALTIAGTTVTVTDWDAASTTIGDLINLVNATAAVPFTAAHDGNGTTGDLLNAVITGLGGAPQTVVFAGGADSGYTIATATEIFPLSDATTQYRFDALPNKASPVVITDDRMRDWDRRDIAPEFTVSQEGIIEFNVAKNYFNNPDFEAGITPLLWLTAGTVTLLEEDLAYALPRARSASRFAVLDASSSIAQIVPVTTLPEHILSLAVRGTDPWTATVEFFDASWASLATATFNQAAPGTDWDQIEFRFGPAGQTRSYDYNPPATAAWALVTVSVAALRELQIDYMHWGQGVETPDHWQPHPHMTVEFDIGATTYEHQPLLAWGPDGEPRANQAPPIPCNVHSATNVDTTGFLYFTEHDAVPDFRWGLGGVNEAPSVESQVALLRGWPTTPVARAIIPDGEGGFFVGGGGGGGTSLIRVLPDGSIDPDFQFTANGASGVTALRRHDNILYVGGDFTTIASTARDRLAAFDLTTNTITAWDPGSDRQINGIDVTPDGTTVFVAFGGALGGTVGGSVRDAFAGIDATTGLATAFDPSAAITGAGGERILWVGTDEIYCCGAFTTGGGIDNLARFDSTGAVDAAFAPAVNGSVASMRIDGSALYIAGAFTSVFATTRNRLAKIDISTAAGSLEAWDPNLDASVDEIFLSKGNVFAVGSFTTVAGGTVPRVRAAEFEPSGAATAWAPELDAIGLTIAASGTVLGLGGSFTVVSGDAAAGIAWLHYFDGSVITGRRHVPYCKMDGLGKLRHVSTLRVNALPWIREVTVVDEAPVPHSIEVLQVPGLVREDPGLALTVAINPGDTTINATPSTALTAGISFVRVLETPTGQPTKNELFFVKEVLGTTQFVAGRAAVNAFTASAILLAERVVLRGYVGQQRLVRLKVRDKNGAPLDGATVSWEVFNQSAVLEVLDRGLKTNQDGEWSCLLSLIDGPGTTIDFTVGDVTVTLIVRISALP